MIKGIIFLFIAPLLVSCISPTPYQDKSATMHDGFVVKKLTDKKYRIMFHGNDETSQERAKDFVLLRAAQEALSNNYQYLEILRLKSTSTAQKFNAASRTFTPIKVVKKDGSVDYTRSYTTQFGVTPNKYSTTRPEVYSTVKFLEDDYDQDKEILDAKDIIRSISKKYNINIKLK